MKRPIYLDHHSTTPVDSIVLQAMLPYFSERYGNPASRAHEFGWTAEAAVELAREQIAESIGARPKEIVFTSGATESNNLALEGVMRANRNRGNHLIVTAVEHRSILDPALALKDQGFELTILPVDSYGRVNAEDLKKAIRPTTILFSAIFANNEIGTLNPVAELGKICAERDVLFHTDAVQALGRLAINVNDLNVDLMTLSAHKIYGPKGVGALYVRRTPKRTKIEPLILGGGHEKGMRSGTLNVPAVVGFGKAIELARSRMTEENEITSKLRDALFQGIRSKIDRIELNGHPTERLANNLNLSFMGVPSALLILELRDIAVSSGSACSSADNRSSHVLENIGVAGERLSSAIRFGIGRGNTLEEIQYTVDRLAEAVKKIRQARQDSEVIEHGTH